MINKNTKYFYLILGLTFLFFLTFGDILGLNLQNNKIFYQLPDPDLHVYHSYINQARDGNFLFENKYAVEDQKKVLFFPLFYIMGLVAELLSLSNIIIIIIFKIILAIIMMRLLYILYSLILTKPKLTKIAWALTLFTSAIDPNNFIYGPPFSTNILYIFYYNPLNSLAIILILFFTINFLNFQNQPKSKHLLITAILTSIITVIHPYDGLLIFFITGALLVICAWQYNPFDFKKYSKFIGATVIGLILGGTYYFWLIAFNQTFSEWFSNNANTLSLTQNFFTFLIYHIVILILIIIGIKSISSKQIYKYKIFVAWLLAILFAILINAYGVLKIVAYLIIPGSIFITLAIDAINKKIGSYNKSLKTIIITTIILILVLPNIFFQISFIKNIINLKSPYFLPIQIKEITNWFKSNSQTNNSVMNSIDWNCMLAGYSNIKSFVGSNQIINYYLKPQISKWFYLNNENDTEKQLIINQYNIDYVLHSEFEKKIGSFNPNEKNYLKMVYSNDFGEIYKVIKPN